MFYANGDLQNDSFNKFVNDLDVGLANADSLPYICNNSPFVSRGDLHIFIEDLQIIKNDVLKKIFIKGPKCREVAAKCFISEDLDNSISSWCG